MSQITDIKITRPAATGTDVGDNGEIYFQRIQRREFADHVVLPRSMAASPWCTAGWASASSR